MSSTHRPVWLSFLLMAALLSLSGCRGCDDDAAPLTDGGADAGEVGDASAASDGELRDNGPDGGGAGDAGPGPVTDPLPDPTTVPESVVPDPGFDEQLALRRLDMPRAWSLSQGDPETVIAIVDSGGWEAPALGDRLLDPIDLAGDEDPSETAGQHGAAAAALIASPSDGQGLTGVCPRCSVLPVRVPLPGSPDRSPSELLAVVAEGVSRAVAAGADVVLVNLAVDADPPPLREAVAAAVDAGVVVVAPAGVGKASALPAPASYPGVVSVLATRGMGDSLMEGARPAFGATVAAPGEVLVALAGGHPSPFFGTSAAAAFVAGVAGLVRSLSPDLPPEAVARALRFGSVPLAPHFHGQRLDVQALRPVLALLRARADLVDLAVRRVFGVPRVPVGGERQELRVSVENRGTLALAAGQAAALRLLVQGEEQARAEVSLPALAPGQRFEPAPLVWTAPAGALQLDGVQVEVRLVGGDHVPDNDTAPLLAALPNADPDAELAPGQVDATATHVFTTAQPVAQEASGELLVFEELRIGPVDDEAGSRTLTLRVRNAGGAPAEGYAVSQRGDGVAPASQGEQAIPTLAAGEAATVELRHTPHSRSLAGRRTQLAFVGPRAELSLGEPDGRLVLGLPADPAGVALRSPYADYPGTTEIKLDAPARVSPDRDSLPVMIFVPEIEGPWFTLSRVAIFQLQDGHVPWPAALEQGDVSYSCRSHLGPWGSASRLQGARRLVDLRVPGAAGWAAPDEDGRIPGAQSQGMRALAELGEESEDGLRVPKVLLDGGNWQWSPARSEMLNQSSVEGWHRVVQVPVPRDSGAPVYLYAVVCGWTAEDVAPEPERHFATSAVFRVHRLGPPRLPEDLGVKVHSMDLHVHGILEWVKVGDPPEPPAGGVGAPPDLFADDLLWQTWYEGLYAGAQSLLLQPMKAWGGPAIMLAASAHAMGHIEAPTLEALRGRVAITDHNVFYTNERHLSGHFHALPCVGPWMYAQGSGNPYHTGPDRDSWQVSEHMLGPGAAQEVTLAGGTALPVSVKDVTGLHRTATVPVVETTDNALMSGRHMLLFNADGYLPGPWHGGTARATPATSYAHNPLTVASVLPQLANAHTRKPFAFAAHPNDVGVAPFQAPQQRVALGLVPPDGAAQALTAIHDSAAPASFVYKGMQVWNGRKDLGGSPTREQVLRHVNPYAGVGPADPGRPWLERYTEPQGYQPTACTPSLEGGRAEDEALWMQLIGEGLSHRLSWRPPGAPPDAQPATILRKVFGVAGTDAHGDFNYTLGHTSTLLAAVESAVKYIRRHPVRVALVGHLLDGADGAGKLATALQVLHERLADKTTPYLSDSGFGKTLTAAVCDEAPCDDFDPFAAFASGRAVLSDGPMAYLALDVQAPFDSGEALTWYDDGRLPQGLRVDSEPPFNRDGRIGGAGVLDQARTALYPVVPQAAAPGFESQLGLEVKHPEPIEEPIERRLVVIHGPAEGHRLAIPYTDAGGPAPNADAHPAGDERGLYTQPWQRPGDQRLAHNLAVLGRADGARLVEPSGGHDTLPLQALTNPMYVTFVRGELEEPDLIMEQAGDDPPPDPEHPCQRVGEATAFRLRARLSFGLSMADLGQTPHGWSLRIKQLDEHGVSSIPVAHAPWSEWAVDPTPGDGALYDPSGDVLGAVLQIESTPIPIAGPEYCWRGEGQGCDEGTRSYVLILDRPRTWAGEALNSVAFPFTLRAPPVRGAQRPRADDLSCERVTQCSDKLPYLGSDEAECTNRDCLDGQCVLVEAREGEPCIKCPEGGPFCNAPCHWGVCAQGRCQCEGAPDEEPTFFGYAEDDLDELAAQPEGMMYCQGACVALHPVPEGEPPDAQCGQLDCLCERCFSPEICAQVWPVCIKWVACGYAPAGSEWRCVAARALSYADPEGNELAPVDACFLTNEDCAWHCPEDPEDPEGGG